MGWISIVFVHKVIAAATGGSGAEDPRRRALFRSVGVDAEIAFLTGFSDQSTFTRAFKRWTGLTPARYRRER